MDLRMRKYLRKEINSIQEDTILNNHRFEILEQIKIEEK